MSDVDGTQSLVESDLGRVRVPFRLSWGWPLIGALLDDSNRSDDLTSPETPSREDLEHGA